jgi:hypothetical protein
MAEFEVNGITYKSTKLTPDPATDLLFDIMPVLPDVIKIFMEKAPHRIDPEVPTPEEVGAENEHRIMVVARALAAISTLPRDKIHNAIGICLSACERQMPNGKGWAKVWNNESRQAMFNDIGVRQRLEIVIPVIQENFYDFFPGAG